MLVLSHLLVAQNWGEVILADGDDACDSVMICVMLSLRVGGGVGQHTLVMALQIAIKMALGQALR